MPFCPRDLLAIRRLVEAKAGMCASETDRKNWEGLLGRVDAERGALGRKVAPAPAGVPDAPAPGRELVFRLELPLEPVNVAKAGKKPCMVKLAPSLNEYAGMKSWARAKARTAVDDRIVVERTRWPRWHCGIQVRHKMVGGDIVKVPIPGSGRRRLVRVTRYSSRRIDEVTCDVLGGKIPIDRMSVAEILAGDSAKWIDREALWVAVRPGEGRVVIEVWEDIARPT